MKTKLFLLLFIITAPLFSQDMERDTIRLDETVVKKTGKHKIVSYKFRKGTCTGHECLNKDSELASMAQDLPKGRLKTLRFNFNNPYNKGDEEYYKDTTVELNFYDITPDGTPGNKLGSKKFLVSGDHKGRMDINVYSLGIYNENGIYIGLARVVTGTEDDKREFEVDCSCSPNEKYVTAIRNPENGRWEILPTLPYNTGAFDLIMTIEQ